MIRKLLSIFHTRIRLAKKALVGSCKQQSAPVAKIPADDMASAGNLLNQIITIGKDRQALADPTAWRFSLPGVLAPIYDKTTPRHSLTPPS